MQRQPHSINLIPSIADLVFCATLLSLCLAGRSILLGDGDTGYHIRAGEYIIRTLSVPRVDIFSYHTPPIPWTAHEWLSEVIMAAVHAAGGLAGVFLLFAFLLALCVAWLFRILKSHGTPLLAVAVTVLVCTSSQIHWLARPHVFSFLMMLGWHHHLERWHRDGVTRHLYLLPVSMLFWVNLHGGYLGGFLLLGAYLTGDLYDAVTLPVAARPRLLKRVRQLAWAVGASLLASLCNPIGYRILLFPFQLVSNRYLMDHVSEFHSPNFHEFLPFKYLLLLVIAVCALSRKRLETKDLALVLLFINMSLYSERYIPLFALVVAPILTRQVRQATPVLGGSWAAFLHRRSDNIARMDQRATGYLWPAAALLLLVALVGSGRLQHGFDPKVKAVAAAEFLMRERITGRMFNDDEFGDYLIYRGFPAYRVFIDGRSDMYGKERLQDYFRITGFQTGWEKVVENYDITWIFYDTDSDLSRYLSISREWVLIYSDPVASIFVKDLPQYRSLIRKYPGVRLATKTQSE